MPDNFTAAFALLVGCVWMSQCAVADVGKFFTAGR